MIATTALASRQNIRHHTATHHSIRHHTATHHRTQHNIRHHTATQHSTHHSIRHRHHSPQHMTLPPPVTPTHTTHYQITLCPHHCATTPPHTLPNHTTLTIYTTAFTSHPLGSAHKETQTRVPPFVRAVCDQLATSSGSSQSTDNQIIPARCRHESVSSIQSESGYVSSAHKETQTRVPPFVRAVCDQLATGSGSSNLQIRISTSRLSGLSRNPITRSVYLAKRIHSYPFEHTP